MSFFFGLVVPVLLEYYLTSLLGCLTNISNLVDLSTGTAISMVFLIFVNGHSVLPMESKI